MASKRRADKTEPPKPVEPVREVAVAAPVPAPGRFDRLIARLKTLKGAIVAIAGVGAVLGGLAGYWNAYQAARSSTESSKLLALVGKGDAGPLSIVVLPFANLTGDPQQAYLADGLTAAVTSDLSRIRDAFIVSAATAFAYKDKPLTVQQIGKELGVRFALQGGVQRSGEKIRINAQLADTTTNAQLWSESFDGSQGDLFALQEMVTARIGNSIGREMVVVAARDSDVRKNDPAIADLMLRARALALKPESKANFEERSALFRKVLLLDPNNVRAMVNLANTLSTEVFNRWIEDPAVREKQLVEARDLALKAKDLDPNQPGIYGALTIYALTHGDHEEARRADEAALSLNPKEPGMYVNLAGDYLEAVEPAKAIELLTQAIRLDPRRVDENTLRNMGLAHFMSGDNEAAIEWFLRTLEANPRVTRLHAYLAMAYARKGDQAKSRAAVASLLRAHPKFNLSNFRWRGLETFPAAYREYWETKLLPAWRLAGLPE
jgi:adenylate cyclase